MLVALVTALFLLGGAGPAVAGPCANDSRMEGLRHELAIRARAGDSAAQYATARSWLGLTPGATVAACRPADADRRRAVTWFEKAARAGLPAAAYAMGDAYEHGRGVAKDEYRALAWYQRAAKAGHARAFFRIGTFHDFARAAYRKEDDIAARWYAEAARRGSCDARFALATMYARGRGVARDPAVAFALYSLVAERDYPAPCYGKRSGDAARLASWLEAEMGPARTAAARRRIAAWEHGRRTAP